MFLDLTGKRRPALQGRVQEVSSEDESGTITPTKTEKTTVEATKTG